LEERLHLIGYRFSESRSGETPCQILGGTKGLLVIDAYTGYNSVIGVDGRERAGCLSHARRYLFECLTNVPEVAEALEMIRQVYVVEAEVREEGIVGTKRHSKFRDTRSRNSMNKLKAWLTQQKSLHTPRSRMGKAIAYLFNHWESLTRFLDDVRLPPDNNRSERELRVVALGRKNFLFVGNAEAGHNLANLYTVVATCEANGVNPLAYLTDILMRLDSTPATRIDELLPQNWSAKKV
jgi:transposase